MTSRSSRAGPTAPVEGPGRAPTPPTWADGWYLGQPDLIVTLPAGYTLPGEPSDVFRIFAVPLKVSGTRYVRGIEFHPGNARVVHHANIRIDRTDGHAAARRRRPGSRLRRPDGPQRRVSRRPLPGLDARADRAARRRRSRLASRPRHRPRRAAAPAAERQAEPVQPVIGFYFSDRPATRTPSILRLGSQGIDIPPGDGQLRGRGSLHRCRWTRRCWRCSRTRTTAPRDVTGTAPFPDGTERTLIHIGQLGLPLAARLPLHRARPPAEGHDAVDALRLRQLGGESAQSADAAGARPLGTEVVRRDGRSVVPAGHKAATTIAPCSAPRCRRR